eukprot:CAMPEP_0185754418 /NCGR_PEP_ID=MMETSP1174-20130828/13067_1 /TAXON_ID=35687 /ORGANISM="Dictyocha speculum, Strain CCMP1381" /LENGTH=35 /DNA_ID= /DNA_START= /DNA_END= /DNA_ORIENTATION=
MSLYRAMVNRSPLGPIELQKAVSPRAQHKGREMVI